VTGGTLSRFYGWHVAILPALATGLIALHLLLVQSLGMSVPPSAEEEAKRRTPMKFFPHFFMRDLFGWILALGVLAMLAALFPWELGEKADPFAPAYENIRPEWYFMFLFQTLKLVPGGQILGLEYEAIPILLSGVAALFVVLVPFIDAGRPARGRWLTVLGVITAGYAVGMTAWGYRSLTPVYVVVASVFLLAVLGWVTRQPGRKR